MRQVKFEKRSDITREELIRLLDYNQGTGVFTWKVHRGGTALVGTVAGSKRKRDGYIEIGIWGIKYLAHRLAWLYTYGDLPDDHTDHINGVRDDNRIANLRSVTASDNAKNAKVYRNNTSGRTGVTWSKVANKWHAQIVSGGECIHLGYFSDISDAAEARKTAEEKYGFHENHAKRAA